MLPHDIEYYRERAETEWALAKAAERRDVAEIHEELARQYEALVRHPELFRPALNWPAAEASGLAGLPARG